MLEVGTYLVIQLSRNFNYLLIIQRFFYNKMSKSSNMILNQKELLQQVMQQLLRTFKDFIQDVKGYVRNYGQSSNTTFAKLIAMWAHPQGISNLVRIVTLECQVEKIQPQISEISQFLSLNMPQLPLFSQEQIENLPIVPKHPPPSKLTKKIEKNEEKSQDFESWIQDGDKEEFQIKKQQSHIQPSQCPQFEEDKKNKRGPYKNYSAEEKMEAVKIYRQEKLSLTQINKKLGIPCKNIKRWAKEGISKKLGGGRKKTSPLLQEQVYKWVVSQYAAGESISIDLIQNYALSQSDDPFFKASRGWATKFIVHYKLREQYNIV